MWCKLPSGRNLCYPYPKLVEKETPWGAMREQLCYKTVDGFTKKWGEHITWYGELVENIVQAAARDALADAMLRLEEWGYNIVMHVHDECVAEHLVDSSYCLDEFSKIMAVQPTWAPDMPIAVAGWEGERYRKG